MTAVRCSCCGVDWAERFGATQRAIREHGAEHFWNEIAPDLYPTCSEWALLVIDTLREREELAASVRINRAAVRPAAPRKEDPTTKHHAPDFKQAAAGELLPPDKETEVCHNEPAADDSRPSASTETASAASADNSTPRERRARTAPPRSSSRSTRLAKVKEAMEAYERKHRRPSSTTKPR